MNPNKPIIIAIDGFSSSGKSTMARALAKSLGYRYVDTGAMYRAVTLYAMEHGMASVEEGTVDADALVKALPDITITFAVEPDGTQHTLLNGRDVEKRIRALDVSSLVSPVAAIPQVRHKLVELQQEMGRDKGIVMDGRDIGTVVFPEAELKIFLNASAQTRAQRRLAEMVAKGAAVTYAEVLANVVQRDHIDQTRTESPLRRAADAIDLDNSQMTLDEQNQWLLRHATQAIARANGR